MAANRVGVRRGEGFVVKPPAFVTVGVPVTDDRGQGGEQAVGGFVLLREIGFGFEIAEQRAAGAHDIHRVGMRGNPLKRGAQFRRQAAQPFEFDDVGVEFGPGGQAAFEQQPGDFLEARPLREGFDIVAAVAQPGTSLAHGAQRRGAGHLAAQSGAVGGFS